MQIEFCCSCTHYRNDGVLLPGKPALQLRRRRRLRPEHQPIVPAGARVAVPAGRRRQRPAPPRPRQRDRLRRADPPQRRVGLRGHRVRRAALRRPVDTRGRRLVPRPAQPLLRALLPLRLRRLDGADGPDRRADRRRRRGPAKLCCVQLRGFLIFILIFIYFACMVGLVWFFTW